MLSQATTLMHPVEAMNHRKSGFFPTDDGTLDSLFNELTPTEKTVNLLDPCCGQGDALAQFKHHYPRAKTYGVELDLARAETARSQLDYVYHADIYDVGLGRGQFDLLFLNPPYGNDLTDNLSNDKSERLEHKFLTQTFSSLKAEGVLVYIVPGKSIDEPRSKWLLARFKDLTIRKAAVDTYKQVVVIGTKLRQQRSVNAKMVEALLRQVDGEQLLQRKTDYQLPSSKSKAKVIVKHLNEDAITEVKKRYRGQWVYFDTLFRANVTNDFQSPIHSLSQWHLALLITSGAVQGTVENKDGSRRLLVKGAVKKLKKVSQTATKDTKGNVTTEISSKDQFSAQIKAIDITPNSPNFGNIITIR